MRCSTPFGITDYIGLDARLDLNDHVCSTPFGITDYIGSGHRPHTQSSRRPVLNAFRHHGLYRVHCWVTRTSTR